MSFDPFASGSEGPPEYRPIEAPQPIGEPNFVRQRVQAPAISLIVVGILNILGACLIVLRMVFLAMTPADRLAQQIEEVYANWPAMRAELAKANPDEIKNQTLLMFGVGSVFGLVGAVLTIAGGIRMLSLKSYSLSVCGAIAAALPCISCSGCCGIGEIIGIWAIVILMNPEVRSAFR